MSFEIHEEARHSDKRFRQNLPITIWIVQLNQYQNRLFPSFSRIWTSHKATINTRKWTDQLEFNQISK